MAAAAISCACCAKDSAGAGRAVLRESRRGHVRRGAKHLTATGTRRRGGRSCITSPRPRIVRVLPALRRPARHQRARARGQNHAQPAPACERKTAGSIGEQLRAFPLDRARSHHIACCRAIAVVVQLPLVGAAAEPCIATRHPAGCPAAGPRRGHDGAGHDAHAGDARLRQPGPKVAAHRRGHHQHPSSRSRRELRARGAHAADQPLHCCGVGSRAAAAGPRSRAGGPPGSQQAGRQRRRAARWRRPLAPPAGRALLHGPSQPHHLPCTRPPAWRPGTLAATAAPPAPTPAPTHPPAPPAARRPAGGAPRVCPVPVGQQAAAWLRDPGALLLRLPVRLLQRAAGRRRGHLPGRGAPPGAAAGRCGWR
jgi:hypothetical protein